MSGPRLRFMSRRGPNSSESASSHCPCGTNTKTPRLQPSGLGVRCGKPTTVSHLQRQTTELILALSFYVDNVTGSEAAVSHY
jgi:hypothetical protein